MENFFEWVTESRSRAWIAIIGSVMIWGIVLGGIIYGLLKMGGVV